MVYWPSLSEWYLVRVQSVAHVSHVNVLAAGVSAAAASAILAASADVVGTEDLLVEWYIVFFKSRLDE
jgi:serine protease inhibitor